MLQKKTAFILSTSFLVSSGMLLGRLTGFAREIILARQFGVSAKADMAVLLLTLPDLIITLLVGGAANIVLIPKFQDLQRENKFPFFLSVSFCVFFIFLLLSCLLIFASPQLVSLLAPGMESGTKEQAIYLTQWIIMVIPIAALVSISRAYLQSTFRFAMTSLENFFYNLVVMMGILVLSSKQGVYSILYAIYGGYLLKWGSQLGNILKCTPLKDFKSLKDFKVFKVFKDLKNLKPLQKRKSQNKESKKELQDTNLLLSYLQALGAGTFLVLLPVIARSFGSLFMGSGTLAIFNYAYKIVELPFGIAISVFSIVIFPKLAKKLSPQKTFHKETLKFIRLSIRFLFLFSFSVSVGLIYVLRQVQNISTPLHFLPIPQESLNSIFQLTILGLIVLPLRGLSTLHVAIMSAKRDTLSPLWINLVSTLLALPLLYQAVKTFGFLGVGVGMGILYSIIYVAELFVLKHKHKISLILEIFRWQSLAFILTTLSAYSGLSWLLTNTLPSISFPLKFGVFFIAGIICLLIGICWDSELKTLLQKTINWKTRDFNYPRGGH